VEEYTRSNVYGLYQLESLAVLLTRIEKLGKLNV